MLALRVQGPLAARGMGKQGTLRGLLARDGGVHEAGWSTQATNHGPVCHGGITDTITEPERKSLLQFARASPASRASFCYPAFSCVMQYSILAGDHVHCLFHYILIFKFQLLLPVAVIALQHHFAIVQILANESAVIASGAVSRDIQREVNLMIAKIFWFNSSVD